MSLKPNETNDILSKIQLFSELNSEQIKKVSSISKAEAWNKNEVLFKDGDIYKGFYILLKGTVKVFKYNIHGKESVLHIVKPLSAFADVPLFEGGNYPATAQTLDKCIILFVPKDRFLSMIKEEPEISLKMISGFAKRLKEMSNKFEDFTSKEVINRLAEYLLKEIRNSSLDKLGKPIIRLSVPKKTIAAYLGTITETLSRTLKKLQDEQIIIVKGKTIIINDYPRLKKLALENINN